METRKDLCENRKTAAEEERAHEHVVRALARRRQDGLPSRAAAGVSPTLYASMVTNSNNIAQLTALGETASKLAEVIDETMAILQDQREQQLSQIADAVTSTAKRTKNAGAKAPFQKTLTYKGETAEKGAKTRAAKKAAKAATPAASPATPAASPTTHAAASPAAATASTATH